MKGFKKRNGISLIVLVLTIIIMIILATAIILSLNNSGIIGKATKAKNDSDTANLKEYVGVLQAEYKLMSETEKAGKTEVEYVNSKLAEKGYKRRLNEDGILLTEIAVDAIDAGIQIGDEVKYEITDVKTCVPDLSKTGGFFPDGDESLARLTTQTDLKWIYIGVSEKGELLISPDVSNGSFCGNRVILCGKAGYLTGPGELNAICDKLYTVDGKGEARSMNVDDVTRILGYTGKKGVFPGTIETMEPRTIGEIEKEIGFTLSYRETPDSNKKLEEYYSDGYRINKTSDVKEMKHSTFVALVYPASSSNSYCLASSYSSGNIHSDEEGGISFRCSLCEYDRCGSRSFVLFYGSFRQFYVLFTSCGDYSCGHPFEQYEWCLGICKIVCKLYN